MLLDHFPDHTLGQPIFGERFAPSASIGVAILTLVLSAGAPAQEIRVESGTCLGVHLVAHGARLSDVLRRLSTALGFGLQFEGNTDPAVNVDLNRPEADLIRRLAPRDSVLMTQERDPRCPGQYRIVKVWVLPQTKDGEESAAVSRPKPAASMTVEQRRQDELQKGNGVDVSDPAVQPAPPR